MLNTLHILATPKTFTGHVAEIQRRAITNWLKLGDNVRVTVLSDAHGKFLPIGHPRLRILPPTDGMRKGDAPEFTEVLNLAGYSDDDFVLYSNADILFTAGLLKAAEELASRNWILCGHRVDLKQNIVPPVDPLELNSWLKPTLNQGDAVLHDHQGIDYFGTRRKNWRGFNRAFIGRAGIDGALLAHWLRNQQPIADCTGLFWAVHQWHDYGHVPGGWQHSFLGEEAKYNLKHHKIRYGPPSLLDADFYNDNGVWRPGYKRRSQSRTIERFLRFKLHISQVGIGFAAMRKLSKVLSK